MKEHAVHLSETNFRKMMKGEPTQFSHEQLTGGSIVLKLHPAKHRKIQTAIKRGKGLKIHLSPDEWEKTCSINGEGITLKSIGHAIKTGWNFWKQHVVPIVGQPIRTALTDVIKAGAPALATAVGFPEAAPAAAALANQYAAPLVNTIGNTTGAFGLNEKTKHQLQGYEKYGCVHCGMASGAGLDRGGSWSHFISRRDPAMHPKHVLHDHSVSHLMERKGGEEAVGCSIVNRHVTGSSIVNTIPIPRLPYPDHSLLHGGSFLAAGY